MKMMMIAALLITLPGVVALVYSLMFGPIWLTYAALASVGLNFLPFLAAGFLFKGGSGGDDHGH